MAHFLLNDLESLEVGVLSEAWCPETEERLGHEDTGDGHVVARGAFTGVLTLRTDFKGAGNVADWDLVTWLLNFDVLEAHELR